MLIVRRLAVTEVSLDPTEPSKEKKEIAVGNALVFEMLGRGIALAKKWSPWPLSRQVQLSPQVWIKVYALS